MNHQTTRMEPRTIGLLATLSLLAISAFTALLIFIQPDAGRVSANKPDTSDTRTIDISRSVANTSSPSESATLAQQPQSTDSTGITQMSQSLLGEAESTSNLPAQSSQPTTNSGSSKPAPETPPANVSSPAKPGQPVLVTLVNDAVYTVTNLLAL